ncbi:MAG: preprotein translocase subunit SecE [Candidatus Uhrbacteria bacterium]
MSKLKTYLKESRQELQKVHWPNRKELTRHTVLVIGVSLGVAAFIGIADYVFTLGFEQYIKLR